MHRRILHLWLPRLATDRIARARPDLRDRPMAAVIKDRGRLAVVAVNRAGELAGGAPGQSLSDARALCPSIVAVPADTGRDRQALARLADWCGRYTPWVGLDPSAGSFEGGLFLDISGCAHLFGGENRLINDLLEHVKRFGLSARCAVADTPGAAWAWARFGDQADPSLPPGAHETRLAPLPVAALRLAEADVETLTRLGLRTICALADVPRAALAARFEARIGCRLDQAAGAADEPISPLRPAIPHTVRQDTAEPLNTAEALAIGLETLLPRLAHRLARDGLGARRLTFTLYRIDGTTGEATVGVSRPARNPVHLARLFAPKLEVLDPDPGVETLILSASKVEVFAEEQPEIQRVRTRSQTITSTTAELAALIDRLVNRLGAEAVVWAAPSQTPVPENQSRPRRALDHPPADWSGWPATAPRPVRLFAAPEPVDIVAEAAHVTHATHATHATGPPDRPPYAFLWRRRRYRIVRAESPERVLGPWWRDEGACDGAARARDYYQAEDAGGRRLWLMRNQITGRWHVHGVMG